MAVPDVVDALFVRQPGPAPLVWDQTKEQTTDRLFRQGFTPAQWQAVNQRLRDGYRFVTYDDNPRTDPRGSVNPNVKWSTLLSAGAYFWPRTTSSVAIIGPLVVAAVAGTILRVGNPSFSWVSYVFLSLLVVWPLSCLIDNGLASDHGRMWNVMDSVAKVVTPMAVPGVPLADEASRLVKEIHENLHPMTVVLGTDVVRDANPTALLTQFYSLCDARQSLDALGDGDVQVVNESKYRLDAAIREEIEFLRGMKRDTATLAAEVVAGDALGLDSTLRDRMDSALSALHGAQVGLATEGATQLDLALERAEMAANRGGNARAESPAASAYSTRTSPTANWIGNSRPESPFWKRSGS